MSFHRIFVCRKCKRVVAGCRCKDAIEENIDACALCDKEKKKNDA